jgi:hypothetical protein
MRMLLVASFVLSSFASAQLGSVLGGRRIVAPQSTGDALFGYGLTRLGDLDGDGHQDLAVGAPGHSGEGTVWILFLDASGSVARSTRIGEGSGGFVGTLSPGGLFGAHVAALGDLDGDGRSELGVSGNNNRGLARLHVLFLNASGSVRAQNQIVVDDPVFGGLHGDTTYFNGDVAAFRDHDGDGTPDVLWGDPAANEGAREAGAVWIVSLNPDGSAKAASRIANGVGGLGNVLEERSNFGFAIRLIGDVNGDGHDDLAVSDRSLYPHQGRVWILFLDADAHVLGEHAIEAAEIAMPTQPGSSPSYCAVGFGLEPLGDLDGDGIQELAIHADYYKNRGGVAVAFLDRSGGLRKRLAIGNGENGLDRNSERNLFGWQIRFAGDLDGDGQPELLVGAPGGRTEAVDVLTLDTSALRNGSGVNPLTLNERNAPRLGRPWKLELDCGAHAPGQAYFLFSAAPRAGVLTGAGEVLVDPARQLFLVKRPHGGNTVQQSVLVPSDLALVNLLIYVQGACDGAPGLALSNALDEIVGR